MLSAEPTRKSRLLGAKLALVGALCLAPGVFAVAQSALMPSGAAQAAEEASPLAHVVARTQTAHRLVITAFGSSSTEGIGASAPEMSYPSRLSAELRSAVAPEVDVSVLNRGVGGDTIDDMMRRLPNIIAEHPDLVIWQIGANDPLRGISLEHFTARTLEGIATLRRAGIDVMLMDPQFCNVLSRAAATPAFREAIRAIGEETGVPVIRRYALMRGWLRDGLIKMDQMLASDGLHMTDGGYALLAQNVAEQILAEIGEHRARVVAAR